ncbi:hypothetical protein AgCh_011884 [Apium graveolens]
MHITRTQGTWLDLLTSWGLISNTAHRLLTLLSLQDFCYHIWRERNARAHEEVRGIDATTKLPKRLIFSYKGGYKRIWPFYKILEESYSVLIKKDIQNRWDKASMDANKKDSTDDNSIVSTDDNNETSVDDQ